MTNQPKPYSDAEIIEVAEWLRDNHHGDMYETGGLMLLQQQQEIARLKTQSGFLDMGKSFADTRVMLCMNCDTAIEIKENNDAE